jgi:hypothetical protein
MIITNIKQLPNGTDTINNLGVNERRKKQSGMLFFIEDGLECDGFIYDGDQVMQLLITDVQRGEEKRVIITLTFNDHTTNLRREENIWFVIL